jgi:hypothetical protein
MSCEYAMHDVVTLLVHWHTYSKRVVTSMLSTAALLDDCVQMMQRLPIYIVTLMKHVTAMQNKAHLDFIKAVITRHFTSSYSTISFSY